MNSLLLHPSDVLFFRDGRPMSGSLSGHGASWPMPTVTNAALHAALHRADLGGEHMHAQVTKNGQGGRIRKFGSLLTAGPFPVLEQDGQTCWYFPTPHDAGGSATAPTFLPLENPSGSSSLPEPLAYPVASTIQASKETCHPWWSKEAWEHYLHGRGETLENSPLAKADSDISSTEHSIGIGIDPKSGVQDGERFYSARYLRLNESKGWRIGLLATAHDKNGNDAANTRDLIRDLFPNHGTMTPIVVGGQQRICTVIRHSLSGDSPLPRGMISGFGEKNGRILVKWVLLTPAIFPRINDHSGGWLPSWIDVGGAVRLPGGDSTRQPGEGRETWRRRIASLPAIDAKLVAAMTGKPVAITGYSLDADPAFHLRGPKPTLLAVPAGSVYYFECASREAASRLAAGLNWHGSETIGSVIRNRRSTLLGEKGFGLGVCGTWSFHSGDIPRHPSV